MATHFYRWLVRLHPPAFRERFGPEMLCVYDEADRRERPLLLADGVASLARQWVARSRSSFVLAAIVLGAVVGGLLQLAVAGTAWVSAARRAMAGWAPGPTPGQDPSAGSAVLLFGAGVACAALLLTVALASLVGGSLRRKL